MSCFPFLICRGGEPVAAVLDDNRAAISARVAPKQLAHVQVMCLFALEVATGQRPHPYRDADAETYAEAVTPSGEPRLADAPGRTASLRKRWCQG